MSPKLPRITAKELLGALHRDGWYDDHQVGSHLVLMHPVRPGRVIVPVHAGRILKLTTLSKILRQAGLTAEQLRSLL